MRTLLLCLFLFAPALAQDKKKSAPSMDYGPFLSCAVISKPGAKFDNNNGNFDCDVTARGFLIKLADEWSAGAVFDSDNLRISAAWQGAPIKFTGVTLVRPVVGRRSRRRGSRRRPRGTRAPVRSSSGTRGRRGRASPG